MTSQHHAVRVHSRATTRIPALALPLALTDLAYRHLAETTDVTKDSVDDAIDGSANSPRHKR